MNNTELCLHLVARDTADTRLTSSLCWIRFTNIQCLARRQTGDREGHENRRSLLMAADRMHDV